MRQFLVIAASGLFFFACAGSPPPPSPPVAASVPERDAAPAPVARQEPAAADAAIAPPKPKAAPFDLQMQSLRAYVRAFNQHDAAAIGALYADEAVFVERGEFVSGGVDAILANYKEYLDAFPDATTAITRSWHFGDAVLFEYVETGTQRGLYHERAPTGRKMGYVGASLLVFTPDGHVKSDSTFSDELTRDVQLGLAAAPVGKIPVRPVATVPTASGDWEVHRADDGDATRPAAEWAKRSLFASAASGKDGLGAFADAAQLHPLHGSKDAKGKAEAASLFGELTKRFSSMTVDATDAWQVGDYVVVRGAVTGKHTGPWGPLPPTKKSFTTHFLDVVKVDGQGKTTELWSYANNYELLTQLGFEKTESGGKPGRKPIRPK